MSDFLQRFLIESASARGAWVKLTHSWAELLRTHDYPDDIQEILGHGIVASCLLSTTIKFDGQLILQAKPEGRLKTLITQAGSDRQFRGLAQWDDQLDPSDSLLGTGNLVITIDAGKGERYQGIVPLQGATLSEALQGYFEQSEQLQTRLYLFADGNTASGMLLQQLPDDPDQEGWERVSALAHTLTQEEAQTLPSEDILHRLFHEESVRVFDEEPLTFQCHCSRERFATALKSLNQAELEEIIEEKGEIETHCEFCNQRYVFDGIDIAALFNNAVPQSPPPGRMQ